MFLQGRGVGVGVLEMSHHLIFHVGCGKISEGYVITIKANTKCLLLCATFYAKSRKHIFMPQQKCSCAIYNVKVF
jgi:hypothetical protein